jgi:hypothetical protein
VTPLFRGALTLALPIAALPPKPCACIGSRLAAFVLHHERKELLSDLDGQPAIPDADEEYGGTDCLGLPCWECDFVVGDGLVVFANDDDERDYLSELE